MAEKLEEKELVSFKEMLMGNLNQLRSNLTLGGCHFPLGFLSGLSHIQFSKRIKEQTNESKQKGRSSGPFVNLS
jgi:hypothetical protein